MKVFNDLNDLPAFRNAVITIGSFDGVHSGHQKILEQVKDKARAIDGESIVITFHPHPRLVVYPKDNSLKLINTIDEKVDLLEKYGVDHVVVVPFTIEFSQQSADEYIEKFLIEKFNPKCIVIGYDHRFGLNRQGNIDFLKSYAENAGFEVIEIQKQEVDHIAISSTKIRKALLAGKISEASLLLNHRFPLTGTVVHGQKIGATLGFPTANLEVSQPYKLIPPNGIYAVYVYHQNQRYGGMLYIGDRPSIKEHSNQTIEVNIFDFDKNIYGDKLRLELIAHIRNDASFDSLDALSAQLAEDKKSTQKILSSLTAEATQVEQEKMPHVAVVILNFNGKQYLEEFLPFVLVSTYSNYTVYVADNGSSDHSIEFVQEAFPKVKIIDLVENHGFAKGYNLALEQVEADYFVLLNSDVEVTPGWMDPIIELMERDQTVGACQPKIRSFSNKAMFEYAGASGGWIDFLGYPFCRGRIFAVTEKDQGQYDNTQEIFWATGAAFFIRAHLFHGIGGFDGDYFAHAEEIDLCWRLKRAGYKIMVRPRSVVYHVGGGTLNYNTPGKTYLNFRNTLYTLLKNEPLNRVLWLIPLRLILDGLAGCLFLFQGKFKHILSIIKAHWTFFPNMNKTWKKRKSIEEHIAKISIRTEVNTSGRYPGSIVWAYYGKGKRYFKDLRL